MEFVNKVKLAYCGVPPTDLEAIATKIANSNMPVVIGSANIKWEVQPQTAPKIEYVNVVGFVTGSEVISGALVFEITTLEPIFATPSQQPFETSVWVKGYSLPMTLQWSGGVVAKMIDGVVERTKVETYTFFLTALDQAMFF